MKQLTKAEEQIMQIMWQLKLCTVKEMIEKFPEPKPAYNTVSTIVRILEDKNFVDHETFGKGYKYFPLVKKSSYSNQSLHKLMDGYFGGSFKSMVSFFVEKNDVSVGELEGILKEINKLEDQKKTE
ncbi:BlaI/MecI/CopY family transcriptional regulator [Aureibaculum luteum]|uniref:BlaI/MecI/CopY family transcriptional regulator n=1 Tax=Aureibaculum luteum TaxID=1548456 RepID=UPI000E518FE0|nr:BlaI/MecI/CopY family transcriptional regulator [Aureibaculum luteum]